MNFKNNKRIIFASIAAAVACLALLIGITSLRTTKFVAPSEPKKEIVIQQHNQQLINQNTQQIEQRWIENHKRAQELRNDPEMQRFYKQNLAQYGNQPASETVTNYIHGILRDAGCPYADMPVYRYNGGGALCGGFCIWVNEKNIDASYIRYMCAHEAGHWYYMHSWDEQLGIDRSNCEWEADEFAMRWLAPEDRVTLVARAQQALHPRHFADNPELTAKLKPETIDGKISMVLPTKLYAEHIVELAKNYPELQVA